MSSSIGEQTSAINLSSALRYDRLKGISPAAQARRVEVNSESSNSYGPITGSQTVEIYFSIPAQSNAFINVNQSYLELDIYCQSASDDQYISGGLTGSLVRSLEITSGGNQIENVENYNILNGMLYDMSLSTQNRATLQSCVQNASMTAIKQGEVLPKSDTGVGKARITCPLISGVLGSLSTRYFPVFQDSALRLRLTMDSPNNCLVGTTPATDNDYTIHNPRLQLEYCILDSDIFSEMLSLTGGVFKVPSSSYAGSQRTLDATSTQVVSLPFRYSSCKNLMCAMRGVGYEGTDKNTIVSRTVNKCQTYWFRQGKQFLDPIMV